MKTEEILARNKEKKDAPMVNWLEFEQEIFDEFYKFFIEEGSLDAHDSIRQRAKDMLDVFIASQGYDMSCTSNRLDFYLYAPYPPYRKMPSISIESASIFSWYGAVNKKTKWLNKITADGTGGVVSHVARTDAAFLGEHKASDFAEFVSKLNIRLKNTLQFAWKDFVVNQRKDNDESQWQ